MSGCKQHLDSAVLLALLGHIFSYVVCVLKEVLSGDWLNQTACVMFFKCLAGTVPVQVCTLTLLIHNLCTNSVHFPSEGTVFVQVTHIAHLGHIV